MESCAISALEKYKKRIGTLVLEGPDVGHTIVCYRGQYCRITGIMGLRLSIGDRISVFQECGDKVPVQGLPGAGMAERQIGTDFMFLAQAMSAVPTGGILSTRAGIYFLCFCRAGVFDDAFDQCGPDSM